MRGKGILDQTFPCWTVTIYEKRVELNESAILGMKRAFTHYGTRPIHLPLPGANAGPDSSNISRL